MSLAACQPQCGDSSVAYSAVRVRLGPVAALAARAAARAVTYLARAATICGFCWIARARKSAVVQSVWRGGKTRASNAGANASGCGGAGAYWTHPPRARARRTALARAAFTRAPSLADDQDLEAARDQRRAAAAGGPCAIVRGRQVETAVTQVDGDGARADLGL